MRGFDGTNDIGFAELAAAEETARLARRAATGQAVWRVVVACLAVDAGLFPTDLSVMTGLDPVIQAQTRSLDSRVKPGYDDRRWVAGLGCQTRAGRIDGATLCRRDIC
jgi:hypothetical protein